MPFSVHLSLRPPIKDRTSADGVYYDTYRAAQALTVRLFFGKNLSRDVLRVGPTGGFAVVLIGEGEDAGLVRIIPCSADTPGAKRLTPKSRPRANKETVYGMRMGFQAKGTPFPQDVVKHRNVRGYTRLVGGGIEFRVEP